MRDVSWQWLNTVWLKKQPLEMFRGSLLKLSDDFFGFSGVTRPFKDYWWIFVAEENQRALNQHIRAVCCVFGLPVCSCALFVPEHVHTYCAWLFNSCVCCLYQKGAGYHLDLFWVAVLLIVCSFMGLPWYVAATVISIAHIDSLKMETETSAPGEQPKFLGVR